MRFHWKLQARQYQQGPVDKLTVVETKFKKNEGGEAMNQAQRNPKEVQPQTLKKWNPKPTTKNSKQVKRQTKPKETLKKQSSKPSPMEP